jgi:hypothetical protein
LGRAAARDFVAVYFLAQAEEMDFAGVDMLRPVNWDRLKEFFRAASLRSLREAQQPDAGNTRIRKRP